MACHGSTKVSLFQLVYGHKAVLPWEIKTGSRRVSLQNELTADEYTDLMKDGLEDLTSHRLRALINVDANNAQVAKWYDKKVKVKESAQGDLVWKLIMPIGSRDQKYGKWSHTWEGPYRINQCILSNAYILEMPEGEKFREL
jgi:hypothetical protein